MEAITKNFTLLERNPRAGFYSRYSSGKRIEDKNFAEAIKKLGGYIYNTCVGKIGDVVIFNGFTWVSVHDVDSFGTADSWLKKLEGVLFS